MQTARYFEKIKRICIVGAGPAGIAAAKHLRAERCFERIDIIDQRSEIGGVWCYEPANDDTSHVEVPQTDPEVPLEQPQWRGRAPKRATYQSPMYARLEANLPKMLMQHSDYDFDEQVQLFPRRAEILRYLDRYAADVKHLIQFETQVCLIDYTTQAGQGWSVTTRNLRSGQRQISEYDAVLVSCGHYTVPFIPQYTGIGDFHKQHSDVVLHAKWFDDPSVFRDKKVLVVGMGPSGSDIAAQISEYCTPPLLVSTRSQVTNLPKGAKHLPGIAEFLPNSKGLRFTDGNAVKGIDHIIFCTGYLYSHPFFPEHIRKTLIYPRESEQHAFYAGERCRNVFQHLLYRPDPTLAFLTLPWNIVPFPVAEAQGAIVARLWSGRLQVPDNKAMQRWEDERESEMGSGKAFHKLAPPSDVEYINDLWHWTRQSKPLTAAGAEVDCNSEDRKQGFGKEPPYWGPRQRWMRTNVPHFKKAFAEKGEDRHNVRTLEELGFHFPDTQSPEIPIQC